MMALLEAGAKILNLIIDAATSKGKSHEQIMAEFDAAMLQAKDAMSAFAAASAKTDAEADATLDAAFPGE